MSTVGFAEKIVEVPLFAELGGFGPFLGRRALSVHDPLYCRVLTVNDGSRRNVVVVTDTIASDERNCRVLRMELASEFALYPESILFMGTHTHSAAGVASCDVGYGEPSAGFRENWRRTVRECLIAAMQNEEPVTALAGKAPVVHPIAQRRTAGGDRRTDPEIRFVKFVRPDGSGKVLLHNFAMHGVAIGARKMVSADWMGAANRAIVERNLAEHALFCYGTAGDINPRWHNEAGQEIPIEEWVKLSDAAMLADAERLGQEYTDDLAAGLNDCQKISLGPVKAALQAVEFPTEPVKAAEYREIAAKLLAKLPSPFETLLKYTHDRMLEMAVLAEAGHDFRVIRDLQVLKMGDLAIFAVPGEPFLSLGEALRNGAKSTFPLAVSVANGDAGYYPTPQMFADFPDIFCCDDFGAFGFYEVWFGAGLHRPKFQPQIVEHIVKNLLTLEHSL